jgi:hypothetical protein
MYTISAANSDTYHSDSQAASWPDPCICPQTNQTERSAGVQPQSSIVEGLIAVTQRAWMLDAEQPAGEAPPEERSRIVQ